MARQEIIFLIGFSGSGKSTIGPKLARRLKASFHDTDTIIEARFGKSIRLVFAEDGEKAFRKAETEVIENLIRTTSGGAVVALGGGAFQSAANRRLVRPAGVCVYLSCSARELYRRLRSKSDRPLLHGLQRGATDRCAMMAKMKELLNARRGTYETADITVSTSTRTVTEVVSMITGKLGKRHVHNNG